MTATNFSLWAFSLDVYARPGVAAECLALQESYGIDVNILLWCLWLESQQKPLNPERLQQALTLVAPWIDTTVHPLRHMRRQLKNQHGITQYGANQYEATDSLIENLRQTIKQAELQAEQQEQWLLHSLAIHWIQEEASLSSAENLHVYLAQCSIPELTRSSIIKQLLQVIGS